MLVKTLAVEGGRLEAEQSAAKGAWSSPRHFANIEGRENVERAGFTASQWR